jgi:hypothetical protein
MKFLITPKTCLFGLIIIFLIVNSYFLYVFLTEYKAEEQWEENADVVNDLDNPKFLESYVNFNRTTYNDSGKIYFYYSKRKEIVENNRNVTFIDRKTLTNCEAFYDTINGLIIDSKSIICRFDNFNFTSNCCFEESGNLLLNSILNITCNKESKCCVEELMCINKCLKGINSKSVETFTNCTYLCSISLFTEREENKYCYFKEEDLNSVEIKLSEVEESCNIACEKSKKKCYKHILHYINKYEFLKSLTTEICKDLTLLKNNTSFGPEKSNTTCTYSDTFNLSCKNKNSFQKICACV